MRVSGIPFVPPWMTSPITIQPWPLPRNSNPGGIVPPWLERDLGAEATHPTTHPNWYLNIR